MKQTNWYADDRKPTKPTTRDSNPTKTHEIFPTGFGSPSSLHCLGSDPRRLQGTAEGNLHCRCLPPAMLGISNPKLLHAITLNPYFASCSWMLPDSSKRVRNEKRGRA